ncbi:MAG: amidophosphoribosyltransferase, partial [Acidobacteria bacterium]|nr:amidophosphoribosyltransferase [Acidobacteriota bacterium]
RAGLPFAFGLVRNHYVGRTFIEPRQAIRHFGVKVKLNPARSVVEHRRLVLVDDSIVRGTTSRKIVAMLRAAGAREVHLRISSPPTTGADSLGFLSEAGMLACLATPPENFCTACFSGRYRVLDETS